MFTDFSRFPVNVSINSIFQFNIQSSEAVFLLSFIDSLSVDRLLHPAPDPADLQIHSTGLPATRHPSPHQEVHRQRSQESLPAGVQPEVEEGDGVVCPRPAAVGLVGGVQPARTGRHQCETVSRDG